MEGSPLSWTWEAPANRKKTGSGYARCGRDAAPGTWPQSETPPGCAFMKLVIAASRLPGLAPMVDEARQRHLG